MLQFLDAYNEKYIVKDIHKMCTVFKTSKDTYNYFFPTIHTYSTYYKLVFLLTSRENSVFCFDEDFIAREAVFCFPNDGCDDIAWSKL